MIVNLKQIREHISHRGLGITIYELKKLCTDHHLGSAMEKIETVENDYDLMTRFFANGFEDAQRGELYDNLKRRLYNIILGMLVECIADQNPTFKQCRINALSMPFEYENIEETLSRYDQELALASLDENAEEKQKNIHQRLLRYRIFLFNTIYTSKPWSQNESDILTKVLLSPLVDVIDQQIILGAMLMAQRTVFDAWKFNTLCQVAIQTDNVFVRERALVGIALGLPDDIDREINGNIINKSFGELISKNGISQELTDLQTQLLLCMDTAKNEQTINKEILPTIMKNSKQVMDTPKSEEEKLEELLHPDNEEKSMEEVEACVDKMRSMQQNGADIFFSGFSQAKRFSFFYTLMNWFCPFYIEHPQVATMSFKDMPMAFLEKIVVGQYFCNSDKYSFILSLAHVINQIPKEMLEMMQKGEVSPAFEDTKAADTAFIRRSYLNDLYRFFNLYSDKNNFKSPFASGESVCFFTHRLVADKLQGTKYPLRVCRQLLRRHYSTTVDKMLSIYADKNDIEYLKIKGVNAENEKNYELAYLAFRTALGKAQDNRLLLSRAANAAFMASYYGEALDIYQQYIEHSTDEDDTEVEQFRIALCQFKADQIDDAMKTLFRLTYNNPEEILYRKALAWGYMLQKKYDEAINIYDGIPDARLESVDFIRKAISQWLNSKTGDAIATLKLYINQNVKVNTKARPNILDMMAEQLDELGIYEEYKTEAMILIDLAIKDNL